MHCYRELTYFLNKKVYAAQHVLNYQRGKDTAELDAAAPLLEESLVYYRRLVELTKDTCLYANSMQTAQRHIPIGGDNGRNKTWAEMLVHYENELANFRASIATLKAEMAGEPIEEDKQITAVTPAQVILTTLLKNVRLQVGASIYSDRDIKVQALAPELEGLTAYVMSGVRQRAEGMAIEFEAKEPVSLLIGYFRDDQTKYTKAFKLETDASANDYRQARAKLMAAVRMNDMPFSNVHAYQFAPGKHTLLLPKGFAQLLGFVKTASFPEKSRNAGLAGDDEAMDWLFYR